MKTTVLHGQNHKGSTWNVTRLILRELTGEGDVVSEFYTNDMKPCLGCFTCITKDETLCPHRNVTAPIIEAIEEADIVIAESPNYCMGMTGQLKMLFDHMGYRWMSHRPHASMKNKIGISVSTTAGAGAGKTAKSIASHMFWWGAGKTSRFNYTVAAKGWNEVKESKKEKIEKDIKKRVTRLKKSVGKVKPGIKSRFMFNVMRAQQKGNTWNLTDRKHWEDNGWIKI